MSAYAFIWAGSLNQCPFLIWIHITITCQNFSGPSGSFSDVPQWWWSATELPQE